MQGSPRVARMSNRGSTVFYFTVSLFRFGARGKSRLEDAMSEAENPDRALSDKQLRAKLHAMWTPERYDQLEVWLRELFREKADPEFWGRSTEEEREKMILELKQRAIEKHRQLLA